MLTTTSGSAYPRSWTERARLGAAAILLVAAFAVGGTSAGHPIREMVLQLLALGALLSLAVTRTTGGTRIGLFEWLILGGLVAIPLLHLVPLPYSSWAALPGRELASEILRVSGNAGTPRPLSFDPTQTVSSVLSLLPGVAAFLVGAHLRQRDRLVLAALILAGALVSLLLGILQFSSGTLAAALSLFQSSHVGQPLGLFANVNHQASLMLIGVVFAGCLAAPLAGGKANHSGILLLMYGLAAIFAVATILVGSRMGILLLPVAGVAILLQRRGSFRFSGLAVIGALLAASVLVLMHRSAVLVSPGNSLSALDDVRYDYWEDVIFGIQQFSWAGSGVGTFDLVFPAVESLEVVSGSYLNHAHNEYLEILFETGVAGAALLALFLVLVLRIGVRLFRAPSGVDPEPVSYAAFTCVLILLGHSIADYPIRTGTIMTIFGFCCAMMLGMIEPGADSADARNSKRTSDQV